MRWLVYKHTSPSGKVYIGITSQNPQSRWNKGKGYKGCIKFFNAILKYGWDNIEHTILADNLTKEEAETVEKSLISHSSSWVAKRVKSHYVKIEAYIGNKWVKFNSIKEASIVLGIEQRNISAVCRGLRKTAGKIKFRYYECS